MTVHAPSLTAPATSLPCPEWCEQETGHGFDGIAGEFVRFHTRDFGEVSISALEVAAGDEGPVTRADRPGVDVSVDGVLGPDEARRLADDLEAALVFLEGLR